MWHKSKLLYMRHGHIRITLISHSGAESPLVLLLAPAVASIFFRTSPYRSGGRQNLPLCTTFSAGGSRGGLTALVGLQVEDYKQHQVAKNNTHTPCRALRVENQGKERIKKKGKRRQKWYKKIGSWDTRLKISNSQMIGKRVCEHLP